jgi:flagella basal body P-ring formation protein FlgA
VGRPLTLTRDQIREVVKKVAPTVDLGSFGGSPKIRIVRKSRVFVESDLKNLIAATLNKEFVHDRGELEIRLTRPWGAMSVPDDPMTMKILDLPGGGISPNFILRSEIYAGEELIGVWQVPLQVRIWKEIYVTRTAMLRGQLLKDADLVKERRDILIMREAVSSLPNEDWIEIAESVPAGQPLLARCLKIRAAVKKGKVVEALVQDGSLSISVKVEVLEDGIPGQTVRVRNIQSRKEFRGKVQNEQTVVVLL